MPLLRQVRRQLQQLLEIVLCRRQRVLGGDVQPLREPKGDDVHQAWLLMLEEKQLLPRDRLLKEKRKMLCKVLMC